MSLCLISASASLPSCLGFSSPRGNCFRRVTASPSLHRLDGCFSSHPGPVQCVCLLASSSPFVGDPCKVHVLGGIVSLTLHAPGYRCLPFSPSRLPFFARGHTAVQPYHKTLIFSRKCHENHFLPSPRHVVWHCEVTSRIVYAVCRAEVRGELSLNWGNEEGLGLSLGRREGKRRHF